MVPILFRLQIKGGPKRSGTFFPAPVPFKTPDTKPFVSFVPASPLRPIIFMLAFAGIGSKNIGSPMPWLPLGRNPLPATSLVISGITKDSAGAAIGGCSVALYRTSDDLMMQRVTSDGSGNYSFTQVGAVAYYVVAYKAGSPDVSGTTVNTLYGQ